jgi:serine/threonine protein kinase
MNAPSGDAWRPDANDPAQSPAARNELRDRLRASLGATYALQGELGGGGMARVFVAEEIALHRQVVVKVLPPETAAAVSAERFRREIQMAARLQHPHIVPLLTAGTAGDILYYTMPMVEGESLRTKLEREGELSVTETVRILREVADALAYAHARGLVHRDIKPDNVLISANHAVVTDFGVAKAVSAATVEATLTAVGIALGTPAYMAPEQAAGETDVDARADLYALGCTAYEMLCGRTPFSGSLRQVLAQHMSAPPQPIVTRRADVPAGVDELIMRLLAKDAADRPATATAVVDALDALGSRPAWSAGSPSRHSKTSPAIPHSTTSVASRRTG